MPANTTTYAPPELEARSVKPIRPTIELDGVAAPWIEPVEITRALGPVLNRARFRILPHALQPDIRLEDISYVITPGQSIHATMIMPLDPTHQKTIAWPLFVGRVNRSEGVLSAVEETLEFQAVDAFNYTLTELLGDRRVLGTGAQVHVLPSTSVVFNPDGVGNRSMDQYLNDGRTCYVFDDNPATAVPWTYADAIRYVVCEWLRLDERSFPSLATLDDLTRDVPLRDVEIFGLQPLMALHRLCERAGLGFYQEAIVTPAGTYRSVLRYFRKGRGRTLHLNHQPAGRPLAPNRTNIVRCRLHAHRPVHSLQLKGRGGRKRFESTFNLVEGWDQSLEINNIELYSPNTNDDFFRYRNVFRKFVLNETGDYTAAPFNQGSVYDLSAVFGTESYALKPRRFRPCLSRDATGKSLGYYLEVSWNGGDTWQPYSGSFSILLHECGICLTNRDIEPVEWVAISKGSLRFRITASIDSDEHIQATITDGPIDGLRTVRRKLYDLDHEFQYRKVHPAGIFYQSEGDDGFPPDEIDDTLHLRGCLREKLAGIRRGELAGAADLMFIRPDIQPGDIVTTITGKNIDLKYLNGSEAYSPQIHTVVITFADQWLTRITFGQ